MKDPFSLLRPLPPLRCRAAVVEPPCSAAPAPLNSEPTRPRALVQRRTAPRPSRLPPRPPIHASAAGSPSAASTAVDSSGEPPPTSFSPQTGPPHRRPATAPVPHPPLVPACRNPPPPLALPWPSAVPCFHRVGPPAQVAGPARDRPGGFGRLHSVTWHFFPPIKVISIQIKFQISEFHRD
jgi:hypothetical protein